MTFLVLPPEGVSCSTLICTVDIQWIVQIMRFDVLRAVIIPYTISSAVTPCSWTEGKKNFEATYSLNLQMYTEEEDKSFLQICSTY
jgi:hypothetical protein